MWVCISDWVGEGIPCFTFVDFYICKVGGTICVIVQVMLRLLHIYFHCIYLFCSTESVILVMYENDSYSE